MRLPVLFTICMLVLMACSKTENPSSKCEPPQIFAPAAETDSLRRLLKENNVPAVESPRGFFYVISDTGSKVVPDICKIVGVNYVGRLMDGNIFDQGNNISFRLGDLITGWQHGLPLIGAGGKITLYIPPTLGYGSQEQARVPAGSNLVFSIDLIRVD